MTYGLRLVDAKGRTFTDKNLMTKLKVFRYMEGKGSTTIPLSGVPANVSVWAAFVTSEADLTSASVVVTVSGHSATFNNKTGVRGYALVGIK